MRLASILTVPLVSVAVAAAGMYVASPVSAECQSRNGTMLCTEPPAPGAPTAPVVNVPYPCVVDWYCDSYGWEVVIGSGGDYRPDANPRPPRPRPTPFN